MSSDHPPGSVTNPFLVDADDWALQRFLILGVMVAGKQADIQEQKLTTLLAWLELQGTCSGYGMVSWFHILRGLWKAHGSVVVTNGLHMQQLLAATPPNPMLQILKDVRTGKYVTLGWFLFEVARLYDQNELDLRTCTRDDLIRLPGVGMKTASFFLMFTRKGARLSCLDVHVLRFMQKHALAENVPSHTPSTRKEYERLEQAWLAYCDTRPDQTPAEIDFEIWLASSRSARKMRPSNPNTHGQENIISA